MRWVKQEQSRRGRISGSIGRKGSKRWSRNGTAEVRAEDMKG
jgi:hypothetical protein